MNYVIIGNGTAAVGAVEGIRSLDGEGKITVISKEPHKAYCRPLISYYLEGKTEVAKMGYRGGDFYEKSGCELIFDIAEKIDTEAKTVSLAGRKTIPYDKLLIASGSSPFVPPMTGLDTVPKVFSFMTLDDALAIEAAAGKDSRVLIVGAGLIGLKCAEGIKERVKSVTVCDLAERVLSSILDEETSIIVKNHLENAGVKLLLGDTVSEFSGNHAVMKSGKELDFDVLVMAVGVRPNILIAKDAGIACGRGISVDEDMSTSLEDIYAAGDCTEARDLSSGDIKIMALMPNAYMQGSAAGKNMAGGEIKLTNLIPMNSIGLFGMHIMSAGSYIGESQTLTSDKGVKKLFTQNDRLKGFIIIDDTQRAGIYTSLIRNDVPLSSVDFESLKKSPDLVSFGEDYCRKKLGGVV